jgi:hypothetical protein
MIPLNQWVKVIFAEKAVDEWGIPVKSPAATSYKVRLDFNADARLFQSEDGKEYVFSATIYFKGAVPLSYSDFIEYDSGIDGLKTVNPHQIFPITDLAGKVIYTKVVI